MLKIGYFADGPWSHNAFERLINNPDLSISFICVRYDTKDLTLKKYCEAYKIPYLKDKNINSEEFISKVKDFNCDLFVSMSFNQIFRKIIIDLPRLKTINCHAGALPFYRGRNILNWALINDEKNFGITVHYIDEGIDTGDIILQRLYPITDDDDYSSLLNKAYVECAAILCDAIQQFIDGSIKSIKQEEIDTVGFYCSQRKIGDENLNWNQSSREIFNFVRSISNPGPHARTYINGIEMKINKVRYIPNAKNYKCITGAVLNKGRTGFTVKTKDSFIKVIEYEYLGKFKVGDRFELK